jgi:hypothetical protein
MGEPLIESEYWDPHHNELCDGGVTVAEFPTAEECSFAVHLLAREGIRSGVLLPATRLDLRWPQVRVSPDDEPMALDILSRPVSAAERAAYDAESECEPFLPPRCPRCEASSEVVLDAVEHGNSWRCELCGECWNEAPSPIDGSC